MNRVEEIKNKFLKTTKRRVDALLNLCQSPIEQQFLLGLLEHSNREVANSRIEFLANQVDWEHDSKQQDFVPVTIGDFESLGDFYQISGVRLGFGNRRWDIFPQFKIMHFRDYNYRVDFAVFAYDIKQRNKGVWKYVIECDGYDYHYKDIERVNRDNNRSLYLAGAGWKVVRFTGNAIITNLERCIELFHDNIGCQDLCYLESIEYCLSEFDPCVKEEHKQKIQGSY